MFLGCVGVSTLILLLIHRECARPASTLVICTSTAIMHVLCPHHPWMCVHGFLASNCTPLWFLFRSNLSRTRSSWKEEAPAAQVGRQATAGVWLRIATKISSRQDEERWWMRLVSHEVCLLRRIRIHKQCGCVSAKWSSVRQDREKPPIAEVCRSSCTVSGENPVC